MAEQHGAATTAERRTGLGLLHGGGAQGVQPEAAAPSHITTWRDASGTAMRPHFRALSLLAADLLAFGIVASSTVAAVSAYRRLLHVPVSGSTWLDGGVAAVLVLLLMHMAQGGHYSTRLPFWEEFRRVVAACAFAMTLDVTLNTMLDGGQFEVEAVLCWASLVPAMLACRATVRAILVRQDAWAIPTLVIGSREAADRVAAAFASQPSLGYDMAGRVSAGVLDGLRSPVDWRALLEARGAQFVVIAGPLDDPAEEARLAAVLHQARIPFGVVPAWGALPATRHGPQHFFSHDVALLVYQNSLARPCHLFAKRVLDVAAATLLVLLAVPVLLAVATAVRMDGGPALFRHRRLGVNGRPFDCLKFRTMRPDAEQVLDALLTRDPVAAEEWRSRRKLQKDPRVTKLGDFLRRTSLDELPQLLNVLRGEMSLVGPRPIVAAEVERYGDRIAYYFDARPGLTGLWQVSGRSDTSYTHRVGLDVWYVRNWSLWHDLLILVKTVPALLFKRGAV